MSQLLALLAACAVAAFVAFGLCLIIFNVIGLDVAAAIVVGGLIIAAFTVKDK